MRYLAVLLVLLPILASAQEVEPPEWLFDGQDAEEELETWIDVNQLQSLEIDEVKDATGEQRSVLLTESIGNDPYMFPGGGWNVASYEPFDGGEYSIIYIGVRANVAATWQVYYVTEEDGAWGEVQRQNFEVGATPDFQDLEWELERGGWQDHSVTHFRIDPGTIAGVEAEIDYISLRGLPEGNVKAVSVLDKLTTTWGQLREETTP